MYSYNQMTFVNLLEIFLKFISVALKIWRSVDDGLFERTFRIYFILNSSLRNP